MATALYHAGPPSSSSPVTGVVVALDLLPSGA